MRIVSERLEPEPRSSLAARGAVERAYAQYAPALVGFGLRLGLDEDDAWEAVQEAHIRLWRHLADGGDVRSPRAWLAAVVYRLAMDRHRLARRLRALQDHLKARQPDPPDNTADRLTVWLAVDRLPERQRAVLLLRYRLDLAFDEIAEAMGITAGAARTLASRGLSALREALVVAEEPGS